jgi:hypothetical protein
MRGVCAVPIVAAVGLASAGCNVQILTSFAQLIYIQPQAVASAPANEVANPGQQVLLDGSQSGIRLGNGTFLPATAIGMTFDWQIIAALDTTTGQNITPIPADAQLSNVNTSQTTFSATTLADYNIQLTVSNGVYTGSATTGVRVISP